MSFLTAASGILAATDPDLRSSTGASVDLPDLLDSFVDVDIAETTALLHVIATVHPDEPVRARSRQELATRRQPVPAVVRALDTVQVESAMLMADELGDGENLILSVVWPDVLPATVVLYIDHAVGTRPKDVMLISEPVATVLDAYRRLIEQQGGTQTLEPVDLADARATIEHALEGDAWMEGDPEAWPVLRPLVEWLTRLLPTGGTPYAGAMADAPTDPLEVVTDFQTAPESADLDLRPGSAHAEAAAVLFAWAASRFGTPMRWSPVTVECALAELPQSDGASPEALGAVPDVIEPVVRYCHRVIAAAESSRRETLEAIPRWLPSYREAMAER